MDSRTHRKLPHIDKPGTAQFITWRCLDALPFEALRAIQLEIESLPLNERSRHQQSRIEKILDTGLGECLLRSSKFGPLMANHLKSLDGECYSLHEWVIMPNHVHVLLTPMRGWTLGKIMQKIKGGSARAINNAAGRAGPFWQQEYFDRYMRSEGHAGRVAEYIRYNPVKANLCEKPSDWPLSSGYLISDRPQVVREERAEYGEPYDPFLD